MTDPSNRDADADSPKPARLETSIDGVTVRKEPDLHDGKAVAVRLTLNSTRDDRCVVRVEDALPETLCDNPVEFHPRYDPKNWIQADGAVVYEAPLQPAEKRITVYGVGIDDPAQLERFSAAPTVEVTVPEAPSLLEGERGPADLAADDPFDYSPASPPGETADTGVAEGLLPAADSNGTDPLSSATDGAPADTDAESPVIDGPPGTPASVTSRARSRCLV